MTSPLQQKLKINGPVVVTANRLRDGAVVWRTADGQWSTQLADAAVVTNAPAATELLAEATTDGVTVVEPYVAPVEIGGNGVQPGNLRERIRLAGPTFELPVTFGV
jgi:hypothetical protein